MLIRKMFIVLISTALLLSFTNCCTTNNNLKDDKMKSNIGNPKRPPSPGNAEISCTVIGVIENENNTICKLKVNDVLSYGSGTRPIGSDSFLEVTVKSEDIRELKQLMASKKESKLLIAENRGGMGMQERNSYRLVKILNN